MNPAHSTPVTIEAAAAAPRRRSTNYPEPFASLVAGRIKRPLGDVFGLNNFGVNLTTLLPRAISALRHAHTRQDEFVFILKGSPLLHINAGATRLAPGWCAGFPAGTGDAHRLENDTEQEVEYLEIGDRTPGDAGIYPDDDLQAVMRDGTWSFAHKDGRPY